MLEKKVRILNLDNSVIKQKKIVSTYNAEIIDILALADRARLWANAGAAKEISRKLLPTAKNIITFLGSGDFHHLSYLLIEQFTEEFSLIVFDMHPDWDELPPSLGCGSWVTKTLKKKNILKCILIGPSSEDISSGHLQTANLKALRDDRLEVYPYSHKPSRVFLRKIPQNKSIAIQRSFLSSMIVWDQLKEKNLRDFMRTLIKGLPSKKVYVSIDKDCLRSEFSLTNWEEGFLSLDELLVMLKFIKENLDIIGLDIVGDYSEINLKDKFKSLLSRLDHPKDVAAQKLDPAVITQVNEKTNLEIIKVLVS